MAGLLTGRYPAELRAHGGQLDKRFDTLAERLQALGYETVGVSDNYLTNPRFGFAQGHERYWQKNNCILFADLWFCHWRLYAYYESFIRGFGFQYRGAHEINEKIRGWFEQRDTRRPFYLMVHYMDTHYPYYVYHDEPGNLSNQRSGPRVWYHQAMGRLRNGPRPPFANATVDAQEREDFLNRYRGSLQYLDRHVGELMSWLRESGEWDRTLVVFTADHGEEFFEHSYLGHGRALYQESVRVPLTVKWPADDRIEPGVVETPVSLLQIMPTVLTAAGVEASDPELLAPLPARPPGGWTPVFSEFDRSGTRIVGGRFDRFKLLYTSTDKGRELLELYDLEDDPGEQTNLEAHAAKLPNAVWVAFQDFVDRVTEEDDARSLPTDTLQDLRSLGYVQ
jgi:arylsulfatase